MSYGEKLLPNSNKLQVENESITAQMFDAELDPFNCTFNQDLCVDINTEGLTYIKLSMENLQKLQELIMEAEKIKL